MKSVGIIGAGFSGLVTLNVFKQYGFQVKVYEKESEVGGVWASSRRYPGLTTQNPKETYHLSDLKMPKNYPSQPKGEQVQKYIETYVDQQKLREDIVLNAEVLKTYMDEKKQWIVEWKNLETGETHTEKYDYLIVCNGIFSKPFIPDYKGTGIFKETGGKIVHTSQFNHKEDARKKHIVVIGFGKSSCDIANALLGTASSVTLLSRRFIWKMPLKVFGLIHFKYMFLTRMGENLIKYIDLKGFPAFLHSALGRPVRNFLLKSVENYAQKKYRLKKLGLHPGNGFETIARANVSLETKGFFKNVEKGLLKVKKTEIVELRGGKALLTSGEEINADVIICGTGWKQEIPFIDPKTEKIVINENNDFRLYKNQLPIGTHNIAFNGYNSSFYSQLSSEIGALWLAEYFTEGFKLPNDGLLIEETERKLAWSKERTNGKNSRGTNIIPFTMHHIDELLQDIGKNLSTFALFNQWNVPTNPKSYNKIVRYCVKKFHKTRAKKFHDER